MNKRTLSANYRFLEHTNVVEIYAMGSVVQLQQQIIPLLYCLPYSRLRCPVVWQRGVRKLALNVCACPTAFVLRPDIVNLAAAADNAEQDTHGRRASSYKPPVGLRGADPM